MAAVLPMLISNNGRLIGLSTPMGKRGWFYEKWIATDGGWERHNAKAIDSPRIDRNALVEMRRDLGERLFSQEFENEFIEAEGQLFADDTIAAIFDHAGFDGGSATAIGNLNMDHFVGVDLGKLTDPTALTVMTRSLSVNPSTGLPETTARGDYLYRWECRALKRYKLGTPYLAIVADVVRICNRHELQPGVRLVLDATGVGVAVSEMFTRALVDFPDVDCHTVSITAGEGFSAVTNLSRTNLVARGQWRVSKIQLIGAIREVLESRRFKVSKAPTTGKPIEGAEVLVRELTNFRERITESANLTYEARQGQHDDLVLATCLPIWLGSQRFCAMHTATTVEAEERSAPSRDDGP